MRDFKTRYNAKQKEMDTLVLELFEEVGIEHLSVDDHKISFQFDKTFEIYLDSLKRDSKFNPIYELTIYNVQDSENNETHNIHLYSEESINTLHSYQSSEVLVVFGYDDKLNRIDTIIFLEAGKQLEISKELEN